MRFKYSTRNNLAVDIGPENIADFSTICVGMIRHVNVDSVPLVGSHDYHVTLAKREKVVQDVAFDVGIVPNLGTFPCLVNLGYVLVNIGGGVHGVPE